MVKHVRGAPCSRCRASIARLAAPASTVRVSPLPVPSPLADWLRGRTSSSNRGRAPPSSLRPRRRALWRRWPSLPLPSVLHVGAPPRRCKRRTGCAPTAGGRLHGHSTLTTSPARSVPGATHRRRRLVDKRLRRRWQVCSSSLGRMRMVAVFSFCDRSEAASRCCRRRRLQRPWVQHRRRCSRTRYVCAP